MEMTASLEGDSCLVLTCVGPIGWEDRDTLVGKVKAAAGDGGPLHVLMDLEQVEYVNSAGLGAMFQLAGMLKERDGKLILANIPPTLQKLFRTVALHRVAHFTDTLEEGRTYLTQVH